MATDMQPLLNGLLHTTNHKASETRGRNAGLPSSSSENRFGTILGTAQARRTGAGHETQPARPKQAEQLKPAAHNRTNSETERSADTTATTRHEESAPPSERPRPEKADDSEEEQDEQSSKARDKSQPPDSLSPEMLLAAGLTSQPVTDDKVVSQTVATSTETTAASEPPAGGESQSEKVPAVASSDRWDAMARPHASTPSSDRTSVQLPTDIQAKSSTEQFPGSDKASVTTDGEGGNPDAARLAEPQNQDASGTNLAVLNEGLTKETQTDPDKSKATLTLLASHLPGKPAPGVDVDGQNAPPSPFDSAVQAGGATAGQTPLSPEQQLGQDSQSSSDSRAGLEHSKSNLPPAEENSLRPQFLDPATGVSPSAPSAGESRIGRAEGGPSTVVHLPESERLNELRGTSSLTQSVTVDLDPLDMGPLRVRVMMTDQTVHAHIRTEHGELGQSLLQQGQSLESSLRTTGLEMGMLRVTVDQQQGRGEGAWGFQQQQGRPGTANGPSSSSAEDERALRTEQRVYNNGRLSFFA